MKTHSLAKALRSLADLLEIGPNVELTNLRLGNDNISKLDEKQVAVNLKTLFSLSKISRKEWINLISGFGFTLDITPRDSSRNIIGKLLSYLDSNPEAVELLKKKSRENRTQPSALVEALDVLLGDI
jgi:hypothetical protein